MTRERIMGHQVKFSDGAARRCHYCKEPKPFGYMVKSGPTQGFFCGQRHFNDAMVLMEEIKEKHNIT